MVTYFLNTPHRRDIDSATTLTDIRKKAVAYLRSHTYESLWIRTTHNCGVTMYHYDNAYIWRDWVKGVRAKMKSDGTLTDVIRVPPAPEYGKKRPTYRVYIRRHNYEGRFDTDYVYGSIQDARKMMYALCMAGYDISGDKASTHGYDYDYSVDKTPAGVYWSDSSKGGDYKVYVLNKDGTLGKQVPWGTQFKR